MRSIQEWRLCGKQSQLWGCMSPIVPIWGRSTSDEKESVLDKTAAYATVSFSAAVRDKR